jgi:ceramide glucosyltransferase
MVTLFYILAIEQILQGLYSFWQGRSWLRLARRRSVLGSDFYTPRIALICPVKGLEPGLDENLGALTDFDYPDYEIFFAVASENDPAFPVLKQFQAAIGKKIHVVVAGPPDGCGEKVNNVRAAVQEAGESFGVFVFTDSDGRPGSRWLSQMAGPLSDQNLGAVTTFRWYFRQRGGFWSALASAWNAPIATHLTEHGKNFCWGGGTAIRREQFTKAGILEEWNGSVSDDLSMTRALQRARLPIRFAPECLVPNVWSCTAEELLEFTNRQMIITRVYQPNLWAAAGIGAVLYCAAVLLGIALFGVKLISGAPAVQLLLPIAAVMILSIARGALRLAAVLDLLPEWKSKLLADAWVWTLLAPAVPFLALWNCGVALFSRRIRWRGIRYELVSPAVTRILKR